MSIQFILDFLAFKGNKKAMDDPNNTALELASNALEWTDDAIHKFTSLESLPEPFDCKPGCHYCCFNLPMVTPPEALLIGHHLDRNFTDQQKQALNARIKIILKKTNGKRPDEILMMRHELPCIFLQDSMCMVYTARPAVCRTCNSTSAEHCRTIFETRNHRARMRCYQQVRVILQTVNSGLVERCREMECQAEALHLAEAIKDFFKHSNPIEAWLQGENVFQVYTYSEPLQSS
jgi:Fe-S-cluster containining protein